MRKAVYVAVAAVTLVAWSVPSVVSAVYTETYGSRTAEYNSWQGIAVADINCDSHDVYADYKRDFGSPQEFRNSTGCGSIQETGTSTNLIERFNSCTDDWGPNTCSGTVYR